VFPISNFDFRIFSEGFAMLSPSHIRDLPANHPIGDFFRAHLSAPAAFAVNAAIALALATAFVALTALFLVWVERKVCARMQVRLGPNRVGPFGIMQTLADGLKLFFKETFMPRQADTFVYWLAPLIPMTASFMVLCVLPFDHNIQIADPPGGVVYLTAFLGMGVFGVLLAGWASNNKYSLLGALRSGAQMISYEVSYVLCMLAIVMVSGTASTREIVLSQSGYIWDWWIFKLPVFGFTTFVIFMISSTAELNRAPFDIAEAESELTGGFHTEYSGISFAMFFLSEYANLFVAAGLGTTMFLGGFLPPQFGIGPLDFALNLIPGFFWFIAKVYFLIFIYMWLRWTFPRLRVDQLMSLEWKFLLPAALVNLVGGATMLSLGWIIK
jgi:NADH-quinone oxidoreductase subunit H